MLGSEDFNINEMFTALGSFFLDMERWNEERKEEPPHF